MTTKKLTPSNILKELSRSMPTPVVYFSNTPDQSSSESLFVGSVFSYQKKVKAKECREKMAQHAEDMKAKNSQTKDNIIIYNEAQVDDFSSSLDIEDTDFSSNLNDQEKLGLISIKVFEDDISESSVRSNKEHNSFDLFEYSSDSSHVSEVNELGTCDDTFDLRVE